jgi:hypothetical protein
MQARLFQPQWKPKQNPLGRAGKEMAKARAKAEAVGPRCYAERNVRGISPEIAISVIVPQRASDIIPYDAPERRSKLSALPRPVTPTGRVFFIVPTKCA